MAKNRFVNGRIIAFAVHVFLEGIVMVTVGSLLLFPIRNISPFFVAIRRSDLQQIGGHPVLPNHTGGDVK